MTFRLVMTVAAAALAISASAAHATTSTPGSPGVEACTKTVSAMGAPMRQTSEVAPDGRSVYRFLLRTNGLDYDVICDATTGVVSDVTPRTAP